MASHDTCKIMKTEEVCRTCLSREDELCPIFDVCFDTITLDHIISTVTGVKIEHGDGLPSAVCQKCKNCATNAFEFKKKSQEADITLRDLYKKDEKEISLDNTQYQNNDGVKTEQLIKDDQDDHEYLEWSEFDEIDDIDLVKNEADNPSHLQCKNCALFFESLDKLRDHITQNCLKLEIDDSNSNICSICGTSYYDAISLTKHIWENHPELMAPRKRGRPKKMFNGTILNKLSNKGIVIKSVSKWHRCMLCTDELKTKEDLRNHFIIEHKDLKLSHCLSCKMIYIEKKFFDLHTCNDEKNDQNKLGEKDCISNQNKQDLYYEMTIQQLYDSNCELKNNTLMHVCGACTGLFPSETDLANHTDMEHPELSLRCNLCTKIFATIKSANRHRSICKQIERKHKCNTCGLKFAYEISLNKHILRYHEGQSVSVKFMDTKAKVENRQFKCDHCSKLFYRKDLLIKHCRSHSDKYYECDVCKKKFNRSDNLRSHKRTHEPREKTKVSTCLCLYCGRSFNNSSNLIVHMRRHTGEKPYKCDFCEKGFPRSSDLQCHRRSHTGEKPYVCGVCGKEFSRSNKLSRHMRVHTGIKPYKCTYCEKAFSQSNDLNLHIRRHTGDKPYICEICGSRFIQGTALQNHRRSHGHYPSSSVDTRLQIQGITYSMLNISNQDLTNAPPCNAASQ